MRIITITAIFVGLIGLTFAALNTPSLAVEGVLDAQGSDLMTEKPDNYPLATLAGGCFWCLESEFRALDGILHTNVGYTGGDLQEPGYRDITTGQTGHAEAIEITFDPDKVSYEQLITFFLTKAHDPTTLNRQGVDVGTQYRSEIFYHDDAQKEIAENLIAKVDAQKTHNSPIVTKVSTAVKFWTGEEYHQQYYEKYEKENGKAHPRVFYKKQAKKLKLQERP